MPKTFVLDDEDDDLAEDYCTICGNPLPLNHLSDKHDECDEDTDFAEIEELLTEDWDAFGDDDGAGRYP